MDGYWAVRLVQTGPKGNTLDSYSHWTDSSFLGGHGGEGAGGGVGLGVG